MPTQVYGLTKGQASPTSAEGFVTKAQPQGVYSEPFNPVLTAVSMKAGFVARGFSGQIDHLSELIQQGITHHGFALIDVLQPCVSFNKVNTFAWYNQRCYPLLTPYDPTDWEGALKVAREWGDRIPIGLIYRNKRLAYEDNFPVLRKEPLTLRDLDRDEIKKIMENFA